METSMLGRLEARLLAQCVAILGPIGHRCPSRTPRACSAIPESFFFQAEDGIRDLTVTGVQTCALPISLPFRLTQPGQEPRRPNITIGMEEPAQAKQIYEFSFTESTSESTADSNSSPSLIDRKSTRLNSSHSQISYAVFCLKKKKTPDRL